MEPLIAPFCPTPTEKGYLLCWHSGAACICKPLKPISCPGPHCQRISVIIRLHVLSVRSVSSTSSSAHPHESPTQRFWRCHSPGQAPSHGLEFSSFSKGGCLSLLCSFSGLAPKARHRQAVRYASIFSRLVSPTVSVLSVEFRRSMALLLLEWWGVREGNSPSLSHQCFFFFFFLCGDTWPEQIEGFFQLLCFCNVSMTHSGSGGLVHLETVPLIFPVTTLVLFGVCH